MVDIQARFVAYVDVQDHDVGMLAPENLQAARTVLCGQHIDFRLQRALEESANWLLIVNQQQLGHRDFQ
jgi:hypothetical protein